MTSDVDFSVWVKSRRFLSFGGVLPNRIEDYCVCANANCQTEDLSID
jgi:hypothetical protein